MVARSGAEERKSSSVMMPMMPSSYYCRHYDADEHYATVDTAEWFFRDTVHVSSFVGGRGRVSQPEATCVSFLLRPLCVIFFVTFLLRHVYLIDTPLVEAKEHACRTLAWEGGEKIPKREQEARAVG